MSDSKLESLIRDYRERVLHGEVLSEQEFAEALAAIRHERSSATPPTRSKSKRLSDDDAMKLLGL